MPPDKIIQWCKENGYQYEKCRDIYININIGKYIVRINTYLYSNSQHYDVTTRDDVNDLDHFIFVMGSAYNYEEEVVALLDKILIFCTINS